METENNVMKKNKFMKKFNLIMLAIFCIALYFILREHHEKNVFNTGNLVVGSFIDPTSVLCGALERNNWDELQLSENFKEKFKNKRGIISNVDDYSSFESGHDYINGERVAAIFADSKGSIFDWNGENVITTEFIIDYKITDDNLLDDITIIDIKKYNSLTGEIVE